MQDHKVFWIVGVWGRERWVKVIVVVFTCISVLQLNLRLLLLALSVFGLLD
jgi:hypothetical protein